MHKKILLVEDIEIYQGRTRSTKWYDKTHSIRFFSSNALANAFILSRCIVIFIFTMTVY